MSSRKKELQSSAVKRTNEWISSQEIPSDVIVVAGETSFSLHKFPLVSKCGYIRKLVSESSDADVSTIEIHDIPGGSEAFELAAKFCYGINFEITTGNITMLRCAAEHLQMTEEYAVGNLVGRTESYLNEVALNSLPGAVTVLNMSESLFHYADKLKLVNRCVDAIAFIACKDSRWIIGDEMTTTATTEGSRSVDDWWAEEFSRLRIEIFQRVIVAMAGRGFEQFALGPVLMLYAQKSLRGLEVLSKGRKKVEPRQEHEKRVVLETIVSLLPRERNALSVSFLSMLLRAAIYLETTVACRLDLEKRMALQVEQAVLDDLLFPSYSVNGTTLFDVETVKRIFTNYLELETEGNHFGFKGENDEYILPLSDLERVVQLMESYLAEIATDKNLSVMSFIGLAELIPEQSRVTEDGMYRAIDIYLKAHPTVSDLDRKKVCSLMDCQKLSREACAHAAQNDRLPVQTVVQLLYHEQQRLRDNVAMSGTISGVNSPALPPRSVVTLYPTDIHPISDELTALRRENEDLKLQLGKLKMKLKEIERYSVIKSSSTVSSPIGDVAPSLDKPPLPRKSFINSVSKKLGRLYPFVRADGVTPTGAKGRVKPPKDRRHSVS